MVASLLALPARVGFCAVAERSASTTPCVMWHPNGKLALTAGPDQTLRLFRTDGVDNPKLQAVHVDRLPITAAAFTADGSQIVLCGKAKHWCAPRPGHTHTLARTRTPAPMIPNFLHSPSPRRCGPTL